MAKFDPIKRARLQLKRARFPGLLKLRFRSLEPGKVTIRMPNGSELKQYRGVTHGGAICSLLDTAATFATNTLVAENQDSVTVELKTNFLKGGEGRYLEATAEVIHHGRTSSVSKVEVRRPDGTLCAYATVTNFIYSTGS